jgi:Short C-terminal domain
MGLLGGIARTAVAAGTWTAVSNAVSRRQAGRWASQSQSPQQSGYMPPPPGRYQRPMFQSQRRAQPPPAYQQRRPATDDMNIKLAQLQRLGSLKAQGVLTDAEFENQKRQILGD